MRQPVCPTVSGFKSINFAVSTVNTLILQKWLDMFTQTQQMDKRRATQQKKQSTMLQSLLWHCHHPAHMGVCGLHASLWGSLNHQHSIVGYWAVLGLKRCECPLVLGHHVSGYVKIIHIQIAGQMILLA